MIEVMNLRNTRPTEPYDVVVDRTSVFGNPFPMSGEADRDRVCNNHKTWLDGRMVEHSSELDELRVLLTIYKKYRKLRLFCWCTPKRCHADYIKMVLERSK